MKCSGKVLICAQHNLDPVQSVELKQEGGGEKLRGKWGRDERQNVTRLRLELALQEEGSFLCSTLLCSYTFLFVHKWLI